MGRITIKDLPKDVEISEEEMKKMRGGFLVSSSMLQSACQACQIKLCGTVRETCSSSCACNLICSVG